VPAVHVVEHQRRFRIAGERLRIAGDTEGRSAASISTRWFSGARAPKISPVKYWNTASLPSGSSAPAHAFVARDVLAHEHDARGPTVARLVRSRARRPARSCAFDVSACVSSAVKRSASHSMRVMRCSPTRRAISGTGGSRERKMRLMPSGTSRSPSANANFHEASALGSWKLSTTRIEPAGNSAKSSRMNRRENAGRSPAYSAENTGNAAGVACAATRNLADANPHVVKERGGVGVSRVRLEP
jgi:hypothetical protein